MAPPIRPFIEVLGRFRRDDFGFSLPGFDRSGDPIADGREHRQLLFDLFEPDDRSEVTRNDLRVGLDDLHELPRGSHHAVDGSAVVDADVRVAQRRRDVSDVHDVRLAEVDDRVAIGVRRRRVIDLDLLAVEVQRQAVAYRSAPAACPQEERSAHAAMRFRMFSCEMITAPSLAIAAFPAV